MDIPCIPVYFRRNVFCLFVNLCFSFFLVSGKVFVTYEADNEKHVKEVINFVALLRHNGFYTHVREKGFRFQSVKQGNGGIIHLFH